MAIKNILAAASIISSFAIFVPYYIGIWKGKTKPQILTWTTWFLLTGLSFILSYNAGGGAGSFTFAIQAMLCLSIVIYSLTKKEKNIVQLDWMFFVFALIVLFFYLLTKNALLSAIFATAGDCLGYGPTFRKSYLKPYQEPTLTYILTAVTWLFSIGALYAYSAITLVYPVTLVIINSVFVTFVFIRRKAINNTTP